MLCHWLFLAGMALGEFMDIYGFFYVFASGLLLGLFLTLLWDYFERKIAFRKTKIEGEHILLSSQEKADSLLEKRQQEFKKTQEKRLKAFEQEKEKIYAHIEELKSQVDKKSHQFYFKNKEKESFFYKAKKSLRQIQLDKQHCEEEKKRWHSDLQSYLRAEIEKIRDRFSINLERLKEDLKAEVEENWIDQKRKEMDKEDKQTQQNLQKDSFFYLNMALNRFDRLYCPERGISPVPFKTEPALNKVIGPDKSCLNEIEKGCGVDILIHREDLQAFVFGIDPVRRELGRLVLAKLSKKSRVDVLTAQKTIRQAKKELFAKIRKDGQSICTRLRLKDVATPVQNMMGALRYRYSFAQNQYFHCEEVAWLCGLLNAELGLPIKPAQRAGMFHDIGKAMDHSIEGNHAVIGAEFLAKYNEKEDILHPVRAHHHDEQPSTALAYLVIVADSISGSRPGARRFTEDSYNQKMANLERIIDSFSNIEDAYIMSAGREMRVIVDNKKITDKGALDLSQKIARKIEKECSYPGLIKVTVVRHSEKSAIA